MPNYYNENDPWKANELRLMVKNGKIPNGEVDERSIAEVEPNDIAKFTQCHFFAGVAGWPLALRFAGWPEEKEVWTASCPCQPYSDAGSKQGDADSRNLWPQFFRLFKKRKPVALFSEQVEAAIKMSWFDGVCADLESEGYPVGSCVLGSHSVGKPHIRQRLYFFAYSPGYGRKRIQRKTKAQVQEDRAPEALGSWDSVGNPFNHWRKLLAEPNVIRVDDGVSSMLDIRPRLHAYGDAIDPQLAAEFIKASMQVTGVA